MPSQFPIGDTSHIDRLKKKQELLDRVRAERIEAVIKARQDGLTQRQIGGALGITEAAVRGLLTRAQS